jgi:hypothetical protein
MALPASEWRQIHALDHVANGIGMTYIAVGSNLEHYKCKVIQYSSYGLKKYIIIYKIFLLTLLQIRKFSTCHYACPQVGQHSRTF